MKYYDDFTDYDDTCESVLILGKFDGIHRGHQKLIKKAAKIKGDRKVVVITFGRDEELIMTPDEKLEEFKSMGVDAVVNVKKGSKLYLYSHFEFINEIALKHFHGKALVCGKNFCFGRGRAGNVAFLKAMAENLDFELYVVPMTEYEGADISSMRIRACLSSGNVSSANQMLGRPFFVTGEVIQGNKIGRKYGFPTANVAYPACKCNVMRGVYASYVSIAGKRYEAMTNVGVKPSVSGDNKLLAESFIFGFSDDIYGENIKIELLEFFRGEEKFSGADELFKRIETDKIKIKEYFKG